MLDNNNGRPDAHRRSTFLVLTKNKNEISICLLCVALRRFILFSFFAFLPFLFACSLGRPPILPDAQTQPYLISVIVGPLIQYSRSHTTVTWCRHLSHTEIYLSSSLFVALSHQLIVRRISFLWCCCCHCRSSSHFSFSFSFSFSCSTVYLWFAVGRLCTPTNTYTHTIY